MNRFQFQASVGSIAVSWNAEGLLSSIDWIENSADTPVSSEWSLVSRCEVPLVLFGLMERLRCYFRSGEPIGDIPWQYIDQSAWSDFQKQVYQAITQIPHGETRTYAWVASRMRNFSASRAVGQALRKNPLPIIIPCHRVVSTKTLGGFMGVSDPDQPELKLKQKLIEIEEIYRSPVFSFFGPLTGGLQLSAS